MKNERVDDIPLLPAQMERMGIVVDGSHTWRLVIRYLQHAIMARKDYGHRHKRNK